MVRHRKISFVLTHPSEEGSSVGSTTQDGSQVFTDGVPTTPAVSPSRVARGGHSLGVNCCLVQHDGSLLTGSRDATVVAWRDGIAEKRYSTHADWVTALCGVPGWSHFVSASADHTVALQREDEVFLSRRHQGAVKGVCVAGGNQVISAGMDGCLIVSDINRELELITTIPRRRALTALCKAPGDSPVVYAGTLSGGLHALDTRSRTGGVGDSGSYTNDSVNNAHTDTVRALSFVSSVSMISASSDGFLKLWDTRQLSAAAVSFRVHSDAVWCVCPLPNTNTVISGGRDGNIVATNFRSHQSSTIIRCSFPTVNMTCCNHGNTLVVCNTSTDVDIFDINGLLSEELKVARRSVAVSRVGRSGSLAAPSSDGAPPNLGDHELSFLSPSRIVIEAKEAAPVTDLVESDVGVFQSPCMDAPVIPDSTDARETWCSAAKAPWRRKTVPSPYSVLQGRPGFMRCMLLHSRRHAAALSTNGYVYIFDLCRLTCVHSFLPPMKNDGTPDWNRAVKQLNDRHPAHATSWCSVHCRWGSICVTLSSEDIANCFMTEWEFHLYAKRILPSLCPSVHVSALLPSVCALPRAKRAALRSGVPVNIGVELLQALFRADRSNPSCPRLVVWSTPNHYTQSDCSAGWILSTADSPGTGFYTADDPRVPSWVQLLVNASPAQAPQPGSQVVSVKCVAMDPKCAWLPQVSQKDLALSRYTPLGEVAETIAKQLKLNPDKLPLTADVNKALKALNQPPLAGDGEGNGSTGLSRIVFDEMVQLIAPDEVTVMDPLMTVWAAYLAFKEKSASFLTIKYRVLPALFELDAGTPTSSRSGRK